jgi:DNA-binding CsgD family transcriptional regulator
MSRNERPSRSEVAIVFIRNPPDHGMDDVRLLREVFGFTNAEASVALALRQGISLGEYARTQGVSQNTVYTTPGASRRRRAAIGCPN